MIANIDVRDALCFTPLIVVGLLLWVSLHRDRLMAVPSWLMAVIASHPGRPMWAYKRAARRARAQAPAIESLPLEERDQRAFRMVVAAARSAEVAAPQTEGRR